MADIRYLKKRDANPDRRNVLTYILLLWSLKQCDVNHFSQYKKYWKQDIGRDGSASPVRYILVLADI
jgi:hypothetical protein